MTKTRKLIALTLTGAVLFIGLGNCGLIAANFLVEGLIRQSLNNSNDNAQP